MLLFFLLPSVALATGGILANVAIEKTAIAVEETKAQPGTLDATVDNIAKETGVEVKEDVIDLVKNIMTQNLNPKTMKSMMENLVEEIPQEKKDEFSKFASKLTGLYTKKSKLVKEMVKTFTNGSAEAKKMRESMKNLNVNSIVKEVNRTFGGQKEWNRIKDFITEVNHGKTPAKKNEQSVGIQTEQDEPEAQVDPIMPTECETPEQLQVEKIPPSVLVDPVFPEHLTQPQISPIAHDTVLGDPVPSSYTGHVDTAAIQISPTHA